MGVELGSQDGLSLRPHSSTHQGGNDGQRRGSAQGKGSSCRAGGTAECLQWHGKPGAEKAALRVHEHVCLKLE